MENNIIHKIKDSLFNYIYRLEYKKSEYNKELKYLNKLNKLYENMNYDLHKFIIEYFNSSDNKKKYFDNVVDEIYEDSFLKKTLYKEFEYVKFTSIYNSKGKLKNTNHFMNKLKEKIDSLTLMLNKDGLDEIDNKITQLINFSYIFGEDNIVYLYDIDKYIENINELDLDEDEIDQAIRFGIKEFNRIYEEEQDNESLLDLSIDLDEDLVEEYEENEIVNVMT